MNFPVVLQGLCSAFLLLGGGSLAAFAMMPFLFLGLFSFMSPAFSRLAYKGANGVGTAWCIAAIWVVEKFNNQRVIFYGDYGKLPVGENAIYVSNHPSETDWFYCWSLAIRKSTIRGVKIVLKDTMRMIPGGGWAMENLQYIFLTRRWENDELAMSHRVNHLIKEKAENDENFWLVIFPEGTTIDQTTMDSSKRFSDKMGLKHLDYLLQPRATGFSHIVSLARKNVSAIYDITVTYSLPEGCSLGQESAETKEASKWWQVGLPEITTSLSGQFPQTVHIFVKRYDISEVPEKKEELAAWLMSVWHKKEERIRQFYATGQLDLLENPQGTQQHFEPLPEFATYVSLGLILTLVSTLVFLLAFLLVWPQWWLWLFLTVTCAIYIACSQSPALRSFRGLDPKFPTRAKKE
eukprot:TRINITY_DN1333_c0_g1_i1.p1 TRINITY_DN1333_c0_g1~~TRINITY_DN1333_c0_g1_i1.p1  ORF type:complete len:407 (-),score=139.07 TRINITY_DN1333_c0_g1_i1:95-1315(-)